MAWSIFTQGGGNGAALTWAQELLQSIGAPVTPGNEQFVFDWEKSEGGGGIDNPLNQGPVPGDPSLTTSGSQYGGGAADYASIAAGIQGSDDYLNMPSFAPIKQDLINNDPNDAETALFNSPWASSHYGYGKSFNNSPIPGDATSILDGGNGSTNIDSTLLAASANSTAETTTSRAAQNYKQLGAFGTSMQYLDGFLNPRITAVPELVNLITDANGIVGDVLTVADRALLILMGAGMTVIGIVVLLKSGGGGGIKSSVLRGAATYEGYYATKGANQRQQQRTQLGYARLANQPVDNYDN
jgi:hypothetical protein